MPGKRKKKRTSQPNAAQQHSAVQSFYTPFIDLDQHLTKDGPSNDAEPVAAHLKPIPPRTAHDAPHGDALFLKAMADVKPLDPKGPRRVPPPPPTQSPPRFLSIEEQEVHNHLLRLVEGDTDFELSYSDEYIDGAVVGLSPRIIKKLRRGEFSYQSHLDLHRMTRVEAREAATRFILDSFAEGCRCVLIVSGRGLNSQDKEPVIKQNLVTWLTQAPLKRLVLAFASARSHDGGAGAFYVLLRRNQGKIAFNVPAR